MKIKVISTVIMLSIISFNSLAEVNLPPITKEKLKKNYFTNDDVEPARKLTQQEKIKIYNQLNSTCERWKHKYDMDGKEISRVNQNSACKMAAEYGTKELNLNTHWTNYLPPQNTRSNRSSSVSTIGSGSISNNTYNSSYCNALRDRLKSIQAEFRAGYTEPRGNRPREERKEVQGLTNDRC